MRKDEESRAHIAVDQENRSSPSLMDLINPKTITGGDFTDYEEVDLMMAAGLKRCYDKCIRTSKRGSASKSREPKRTTDFSGGSRIGNLICDITEPGAVTNGKRA